MQKQMQEEQPFEELLASDLPATAPPAEGPSTPLKPPSVKKSKGQSKLKFKKEEPHEKDEMDIEGIDVDKDFEEKLSQTSKASRPRLASAVESKMQIILKAITDFGDKNKLSLKEISNISQDAYNNVANAEKMHNMSQLQAATQMIENITKNAKTATDPMILLYNIGLQNHTLRHPQKHHHFQYFAWK